VGPELTEVAKKSKPETVLEDIVEPSKRINEQFQQWTVNWRGRNVTGLKKYEDKERIVLLTDPLVSCEPTVIPKSDLEDPAMDVRLATSSTMPNGLLNRFTREEILDLLSFVLSGGNPDHEYFTR
jgi:putative heme-binding domain-containing protein